MHRLAFELERLYNDELTPRIQMPLAMFKTKAYGLIKYYREKLNTAEIIDVLEIVVDELATHFVVSREAAKIRLNGDGEFKPGGEFK